MRILIVEDEPTLRAQISQAFADEGYVAESAGDGEQGLYMAQEYPIDLAVIDLGLPKLGGVELIRRLRKAGRTVPVLILTARDDSVERVIGLEIGADDYLPKPIYPRELVARLRAVLRRVQAEPRDSREADLRAGPLWISPASRQASLADQPLNLTVVEFNMLVELARHCGDVLSKDDLYERTLGRKREPYDRSVDVHVSNIRQKLAAIGGIEIETARAVGYRLVAS